MPDPQLAASYAHCRRIARAAARNFYYGFRLLPRPKGDALCAIYAFMRQADDLSDSDRGTGEKRTDLAAWREKLEHALAGRFDGNPVLPAFHDAVARHKIPPRYFFDLISGVEMDLTVTAYRTFDELQDYCYHVAGTVGLSCLYVFGFSDERAPELAGKLGLAFQLTNILRDVSEDLVMGRVYIPEEDLQRFGCTRAELRQPVTPAFVELMRFESQRAWRIYGEGVGLLSRVSPDSRAALWALIQIYSGILKKIEARNYDVLSPPRTGLSTAQKLWILARGHLGWTSRPCPAEK